MDDWSTRLYRKIMDPLLHNPLWQWGFLLGVAALLILAMAIKTALARNPHLLAAGTSDTP